MSFMMPFNLQTWVAENRQHLKPPVSNKMLFNGNFMVMVVGGPNQRNDYHVNPGEELFYQIEGDIVMRIREDGEQRDVPIRQGEIFLLPAGIPHSPQRPANTIGLVIEHMRDHTADDHLRWYCSKCGTMVYDAEFHCIDLGKQLKPVIEAYNANKELRTCKKCGTVN